MAAKGATAALLLLLLAALLVSAPPTAAAAAAAEQKGGEMNSPHTVSTACSSWSVVRPLRLRVRDPRRGSVLYGLLVAWEVGGGRFGGKVSCWRGRLGRGRGFLLRIIGLD
jgi:hypothetical protein